MDAAQKNSNLTNEELQSRTISFLRFPLIVGVVLIHLAFLGRAINLADYPIYHHVSYLFSEILARIAVPLFFFISGFLFFYKTDLLTTAVYLQKLKKRVHTILIPYIFWNLIVILFYLVIHTLIADPSSESSAYRSFSEWLWAFWDTSKMDGTIEGGGMPINYPLWFIRDLMVVICFSPLIYFLVRKLRQYALICLGIAWVLNCQLNIPGFSITAFFFFSAGAFFSIFKKNFVVMMKPWLAVSATLYVLTTATELYFLTANWAIYLHNTGILVGIIAAVAISAHFIAKGAWRVNTLLTNSSFFIYAYHAMFLLLISRLIFQFIPLHSEGILLALYAICPTVIILVGLLLYALLRKYLPTFTAIITGGR